MKLDLAKVIAQDIEENRREEGKNPEEGFLRLIPKAKTKRIAEESEIQIDISPDEMEDIKKCMCRDLEQLLEAYRYVNPRENDREVVLKSKILFAKKKRVGSSSDFAENGLLLLVSEKDKLIRKGLDFAAIQNSQQPCYVTCLAIPDCSVHRFDLRRYSAEDMTTLLLASSAIPIIFDSEEFQGKQYYDGGIPFIGDNVPIQPIYDLGIDCIIVVHLSQDYVIDHLRYPNAKIIEIIPQVNLGGPIDGTLDFTAAGSKWRIQQGYQDAEQVFGMFAEIAKTRRKNELVLQAFQQSSQIYQQRMQALQEKRRMQQIQKEQDGFNEMCKDLGVDI